MIFSIFLLIFFVFLFNKYKLHKERLMKYVKHLPSPPHLPFIGSGHLFIGKNTKEIFEIFMEHFKVETPAAMWLGPKLHILINTPEDMQTVLLSPNCLDKPYIYRFLPNQRGIITAEAHIWKPNRKLFNPTFNSNIVKSFVPIFNEKTNILVQKLKQLPDKQCVDVSEYIFACTLDMVCATTLGYDLQIQKDKNKEFLECLESMLPFVATRIVKIWLHPTWIYKMTPSYQIEKRLSERLRSITRTIKEDKQREYDEKYSNYEKNTTEEEEFSKPQIFIDELLKLLKSGKVSDEEITDQVITIIVTGNETSSLVLSHTVLMLAMYPKYQEKVYAELCSVDRDSEITLDFISQLPYLEMVIKEVMRLFPVAALLARHCLADTKISNCTIPRGTFVIMFFYALHRNPKYWGENPDDFNPENFLPERIAARHPYAYLPFSGGTRNCIGTKYAWISMKILLANLLLNFKFSTKLKMEDLRFRWDMTLKFENKQWITLEKRINEGSTVNPTKKPSNQQNFIN